ncbi:MAG: putative metal-binding motif-containing protein [Nanoarchaeota archaeon]|nr:putative metal-binding motif-containing protein [Nanoarchaeota archaeon]MBU1321987.1 putative metal-binding motif-containing protein [Nanoarchaeota archaeon]MBU1597977.1 putative metal-binding motif-containing protein [Nanoarchaeota archaeon]
MNKKLLTTLFVIVMTVLSLAAVVLAGKPGIEAVLPGTYDDANFFAPDYNNGASETFNAGESRTFNYECSCDKLPGDRPCNGNIILQVNDGSGFVNEKTSACNVPESGTCSASHTILFDEADTYIFRVFCDESSGVDFTQPSNEYVALTAVSTGCTNGETRACPNQLGVCAGSVETCTGEVWPGCDYSSISGYEVVEATCDDLDNDCNGAVDDVDADGDGSGACASAAGTVNELLLTGLNNDPGSIDIFEYQNDQYMNVWSTSTPGISNLANPAGGEIGDVTHDGVNDFVITRYDGTNFLIEVWTYDNSNHEWYNVWTGIADGGAYVADIGDFDNDGFTEFALTVQSSGTGYEIWGNDVASATTFSREAIVKDFGGGTTFIDGSGDLNNNGIPELIFQDGAGNPVEIWEWTGSSYELQSIVNVSISLVDDIECSGDVNRDGVVDCVIGGNSEQSHILTYSGFYFIDYNTPETPSVFSFTQSVSIGDITNDGYDDWVDGSKDGPRVFSYNGVSYANVWNSPVTFSSVPGIGSSFVGDCDNDGKSEFIFGYPNEDKYMLWESDAIGATSFDNTFTWSNHAAGSMHVMIGNLNPFNDGGVADCNDNNENIYPGATEICGNGIDDNCNDEIDEGCTDCINGETRDCPNQVGVCAGSFETCTVEGAWPGCDYSGIIGYEAVETTCDSLDNDCDSLIDEGCPICDLNTTQLCPLQDGVCEGAFQLCLGDSWTECYYGPYYEDPEATCDGLDNDCDTSIDEGLLTTYYEDFDVDTYGNLLVSSQVCSQPAGYVLDNQDCNDNNDQVNPGMTEVCDNGIDDNCNDEIDEGCSSGPFCGDGYCDGRALGEDCTLCPADCWAEPKGACCGDNKCDTKKGETALLCPVDCS